MVYLGELVAELELAVQEWTRSAIVCQQNPDDDAARRECDHRRNVLEGTRRALLGYIEGKA